jgi:peroxiredoxin
MSIPAVSIPAMSIIIPRRSLLLGAAALAVMPAGAFAASDLGKPAPAFSATDSNGKTWSLDQLRGKVVVLETTNRDCPYVGKHYRAGNMQAQQHEAATRGVVWLTVAASAPGEQGFVTASEANDTVKKNGAAPAAVLLDPKSRIARAYGATVTPHMYVIDAAGVLVYKGGIDSIPSSNVNDIAKAKQYVRAALDEVLAGKPVSAPSTRPYGCSLKYGSNA